MAVAAMIVMALLAVFAVQLADNQANSRQNLERTAQQRAVLVTGLVDEVFAATSQPAATTLAQYGTQTVADAELQRNLGASDYLALYASSGDLVAHTRGFTAQARADLTAPTSALAMLRRGQPWALGDVSRIGGARVVDFATRLQTPAGVRYLVTGIPAGTLSAFTGSELAKIPGVLHNHSLLVDGRGVVIASTNPLRPPGYVFHTRAQLQALHGHAGVVSSPLGAHYFDSVPMTDTSWRLILSAPASAFFASVSGPRHWLPWLIFAAFGLVATLALLLVRRAFRDAERVREVNGQLTMSNASLAHAKASLEEANDALGDSNRALARSNHELERQARELVRSNAELDQFASIASHDLQEPLRKVRTFTERISETEADSLSERGLDYLRRANSSAERMQTLIEDLLRYSRVSSHARPFTPVDLRQLTAEVLEDLSEQVRRDEAIVHVGEMPTINADGPQIRQLIQNLISNGLKFRREGVAPEVRIEATAEAGWVTLTVTDNGIGFDPQYRQRIFRVFERLHGRGTYAGTGIGLALCRKIAERHGGSIEADGVPGGGATFRVTMQTQRTEAVLDAPAAGMADRAPAIEQEPYVPA
ncbi:MAG: hypothetical protein JOZ07_19530 [Solirubrobacterales bacterium]|nr:hypothetical protein [Solirubrobacterales bacterium]